MYLSKFEPLISRIEAGDAIAVAGLLGSELPMASLK
jgi:hypothetical protein